MTPMKDLRKFNYLGAKREGFSAEIHSFFLKIGFQKSFLQGRFYFLKGSFSYIKGCYT